MNDKQIKFRDAANLVERQRHRDAYGDRRSDFEYVDVNEHYGLVKLALGLLADSEPATVNTTALLSDLEASVTQEILDGVCNCGCTDGPTLNAEVFSEVRRIVLEHCGGCK